MLKSSLTKVFLILIFGLSLGAADEKDESDKKEEPKSTRTDSTQSINLGRHHLKSSAPKTGRKPVASNSLNEILVDQSPTHGTMVTLETSFYPKEYFTKTNKKNAWLIIEIYNMNPSSHFPKTMEIKEFCDIRYEEFENRTILVFQFKSGKIPKYQILPHDGNLLVSFPDAIFKNKKGQSVPHQQVFKSPHEVKITAASPGLASVTVSHALKLSSKVSINLQNAPLNGVLKLFEKASNYKLNNNLSLLERVSIDLIDIPWVDALEVILMYNGYGIKVSNRTIKVMPEKH